MKNNKILLLVAGLSLCAAMPVLAQEKTGDEKKLEKVSMELENDAGKQEGGAVVVEKLKTGFGVDDALVQGLRDQKMGYGEITITLGLAQQLPGGITDENVQKIMAMRQGPPVIGWGKIAQELGFKLGPVISKVKKVSAEARKQAAKMKKGEKGKMEKHERHEKPEKMGRPEKGARPGTHGRP